MNATIYRDAASEHITTAELLLDNSAYVGAFYFAGLAVECLFRAYRYHIDPEFDARHDLYELARVSQFFRRLSVEETRRSRISLEQVALRWTNAHRYRSARALRSFLIKLGLHRLHGQQSVRGDVAAYNARIIVYAATELVEWGTEKWDL